MSNRPKLFGLCLLAGFTLAVLLACDIQAAFAHDNGTGGGSERVSSSAKGPYYVDFRARTAASWGHAFVWYGKTSERQVEVAGLTPAGDTLAYVLGHMTLVPSETGASYGDLDPQYLTASYRVYLNEADAKKSSPISRSCRRARRSGTPRRSIAPASSATSPTSWV